MVQHGLGREYEGGGEAYQVHPADCRVPAAYRVRVAFTTANTAAYTTSATTTTNTTTNTNATAACTASGSAASTVRPCQLRGVMRVRDAKPAATNR